MRVFSWIAGLLAIAVIFFAIRHKIGVAADARFERLVRGDQNVKLLGCQIEGHGKSFLVRDETVLEYLTLQMRKAEKNRQVPGWVYSYSYFVKLDVGLPVWVEVGLSLDKNVDRAEVRGPLYDFGFPDPPYYLVTLCQPIPEPWVEIMWQMRNAH